MAWQIGLDHWYYFLKNAVVRLAKYKADFSLAGCEQILPNTTVHRKHKRTNLYMVRCLLLWVSSVIKNPKYNNLKSSYSEPPPQE